MWDYDPKKLKEAIADALGPEAVAYEIRFRPMFGGIMAYTFGRPFASLSNAGIALKLSEAGRERLIGEGGYPLRYKPDDPPSKSYTVIPKALIDERAENLRAWLITGMIHCKALPLKKRKSKAK